MQQEGSAHALEGEVRELLAIRAKMVTLLQLVDVLLADSGVVAEEPL